MSSILSSLKGYASSSRSSQGGGGSHRKLPTLFAGATESLEEVPYDPGFEDAKRRCGELDVFFTTVYQAYLQATSGIIDVARPLNRLESTIREYFEDQENEDEKEQTRIVRRFSSSVVKLNVATMRFEEVLEEGRLQADLEEWLLKLEEIKRDIEARERLHSEYVREKRSWTLALHKAENKRMTEEPSVQAKLNRLEASWQAAHEGFKRVNKKVTLSVHELSTQVKPALQHYLHILGMAQYGLYHTLNLAYAEWEEEEHPHSVTSILSIIPSRIKTSPPGATSSSSSSSSSATTTTTSGNAAASSPPASSSSSVRSTEGLRPEDLAAPEEAPPLITSVTPSSPVPPPKTNHSSMHARLSTLKQRHSTAKPLPKPPSPTYDTAAGDRGGGDGGATAERDQVVERAEASSEEGGRGGGGGGGREREMEREKDDEAASLLPLQTANLSTMVMGQEGATTAPERVQQEMEEVEEEEAAAPPATETVTAMMMTTTMTAATQTPMMMMTAVERRLEEEERREQQRQSERLAVAWREVEAAQVQLKEERRAEREALRREQQAWEEALRDKMAQARLAQQQLEEERSRLEAAKRELERKEALVEQREQGRQEIEQEFLRMHEERRLIEEKKRALREQKLKRQLEAEWQKIEEARQQLAQARQAEHARAMEAQNEQLRLEQQRLALALDERRRRDDAQLEEEMREQERLLQIRRQVEDERRKLDRSLRTLGHLAHDDDDDCGGGAEDVTSNTLDMLSLPHSAHETHNHHHQPPPIATSETAQQPVQLPPAQAGVYVAVQAYVATGEGELDLLPGFEVQLVDGGPDDQVR